MQPYKLVHSGPGGGSDLTSVLCVEPDSIANFKQKLARALKALVRISNAKGHDVVARRQLSKLAMALKAFQRDIVSGEVVHRRDAPRLVQARTALFLYFLPIPVEPAPPSLLLQVVNALSKQRPVRQKGVGDPATVSESTAGVGMKRKRPSTAPGIVTSSASSVTLDAMTAPVNNLKVAVGDQPRGDSLEAETPAAAGASSLQAPCTSGAAPLELDGCAAAAVENGVPLVNPRQNWHKLRPGAETSAVLVALGDAVSDAAASFNASSLTTIEAAAAAPPTVVVAVPVALPEGWLTRHQRAAHATLSSSAVATCAAPKPPRKASASVGMGAMGPSALPAVRESGAAEKIRATAVPNLVKAAASDFEISTTGARTSAPLPQMGVLNRSTASSAPAKAASRPLPHEHSSTKLQPAAAPSATLLANNVPRRSVAKVPSLSSRQLSQSDSMADTHPLHITDTGEHVPLPSDTSYTARCDDDEDYDLDNQVIRGYAVGVQ